MSGKLNIIVDDAFSDLYNFICQFIPNVYDKVAFLTQKFYLYFHKRPENFFLMISYGTRIIILLFFLIDVFIFFKLNFMYKALYLLGINMLIKLLFYVLKDFSTNLESIEDCLIIEDKGIDKETNLPITNYKLKEEYEEMDLEYYVDHYILCSKISGYLEMYHRYSDFLYPYITTLIYSGYLIGWVYVIIKNIIIF